MVLLSMRLSELRLGIMVFMLCFALNAGLTVSGIVFADTAVKDTEDKAAADSKIAAMASEEASSEGEAVSGDKNKAAENTDLQKRLAMVRNMLRANKPELAEKLEADRKRRRERINSAFADRPGTETESETTDMDEADKQLSKDLSSDKEQALEENKGEKEDKSVLRDAVVTVVKDYALEKEIENARRAVEDESEDKQARNLEEVDITDEFKEQYTGVFDSAVAMNSIEEEILPVEVVYLDKDAKPSRGLGKRAEHVKAGSRDIPLEKIVPEYVPHKWYPKNEQFSVYKLSCPSAFLPKRRTSSIMYKYGVKKEKAYDRFLGNQLIHDAESVGHSIYYSYALSDNFNFTAGITKSDNSFDLNRNASAVKNFENYRNAVLNAAGQSTIAALISSQPVTYTPSRDMDEVTLAFQAKLYSWDEYKTSLGCGVVSNRDRLKEEAITLYAGLPGLPVSFEDVFLEYQSHEAYLVFSKVIAKNLVAHAGYMGKQIKTAILTDMSRDKQDFHYPFGGIDLILNEKTRIKAGYKDGEPLGELFYHASDDFDVSAYYKSENKVVKDDANSFDNYNILREIEDFGISMSHRF